ncbi:HAMP domain-containing sensor histidine kinase [Candidatus Liberibacter sp.]|uniref:PAS domain-containing sensor histidine kinase n=1 Tax=Candidatus Liberibacter sp. TaxID=34022 RepID=UPI0015F4F745|nr:HAMP domain-containing sensor histidine kinase [Candidatus Liberibacter sp.]MBA5724297.1 HAMP domain-containing histidine kinase [Candidatus Liberibacter sp.]
MVTDIDMTGMDIGTSIWWMFSSYKMAIFIPIVGIFLVTIIPIVLLVQQRNALAKQLTEVYSSLSETYHQLSKYQSLITDSSYRIVVWDGDEEIPEIIGQLPPETNIPQKDSDFLSFEDWLKPHDYTRLSKALEELREDGKTFDLLLESQGNCVIRTEGRVSGSYAFLRVITLDGIYAELAETTLKYNKLISCKSVLKLLLNSLDSPVWQRDQRGKLIWESNSFRKNAEESASQKKIFGKREFLDEEVRKRILSSTKSGEKFCETISCIENGILKSYKIINVTNAFGEAGIAIDVSRETEATDQLTRTYETLHHLTVAIAIFDKNRCLQFYNQSFMQLWEMNINFLSSNPSNDELLELLRSLSKLPEQLNWKSWKENVFSVYVSSQTYKDTWHLPSGQTLRVIAVPLPQGGAIWMFENLTAQVNLQTKYNTLVKVQGETIDHLSEGVAVFGPDGKIKLSNPAFRFLWEIQEEQVLPGTHIRNIAITCSKNYNQPDDWDLFVTVITSFEDERKSFKGTLELLSDLVLEYAVIPLPNAQTMLTFVNVTDSVRAERALTEKNEALRKADEIKNNFVQHVSYELRSPLTNIIGFTDLLKKAQLGSLNARQSEYVEYISNSSSLLLNLVNDILDLATVDAGIMKLNYSEIDIDDLLDEVTKCVANKMHESDITLKVFSQGKLNSIEADRQRLIQIFVKLLSNATDFSPRGSIVTLKSSQDGNDFVFSVTNNGPEIPEDMIDSVFNRFFSDSHHGKRRGAGLGLSIVKSFLSLHGGTASIKSTAEGGTTITCRIPFKKPQ